MTPMAYHKIVCIKFDTEVLRNKAAFLNNQPLKWSEKVRYLGNIIDMDCTSRLCF